MKRFVLTKPAEDDLHQIKNYLVGRAGPAVARQVMREIRLAMDLVGGQPDVGHVREDLTSRPLKFWAIFSYLVVYVPNVRPVEIIRVLHGAQDVEHLL
jgi:toxin ParE1/3/4